MADDAFALSPISARPSEPGEADYEAIRDAFLETARGRWFLNEYTRRNRNADTRMVLDAVARIEATIAVRTPPAAAPSSPESFGLVQRLLRDARVAAAAAMTAPDADAKLAAARKGARIVREIAWSLRECGTDIRICDILDAQLGAIDALHDATAADNRGNLLSEIFDDLLLQVEEIGAREAPPPSSSGITTPAADAGTAAQAVADAGETVCAPTEDELARDDAVLDLIAMEMAAPDEGDDAIDDFGCQDPDDAAPMTLAVEPEAIETDRVDTAAVNIPDTAAAETVAPPEVAPSLQASLGAALISSGIVPQPRSNSRSGADPLAPFRRMSQAEKVAFFS